VCRSLPARAAAAELTGEETPESLQELAEGAETNIACKQAPTKTIAFREIELCFLCGLL
jgi:hypothetical protein